MRLTLRLLTLALLLSVATFTNLVSPVSKASPCTDGCAAGYRGCRTDCAGSNNPGCVAACEAVLNACLDNCGKPNFD